MINKELYYEYPRRAIARTIISDGSIGYSRIGVFHTHPLMVKFIISWQSLEVITNPAYRTSVISALVSVYCSCWMSSPWHCHPSQLSSLILLQDRNQVQCLTTCTAFAWHLTGSRDHYSHQTWPNIPLKSALLCVLAMSMKSLLILWPAVELESRQML